MRRYVTLFEAPFEASVLSDHENNTLRAGSLLAVPPPAPGSQPLAGLTTVDLLGNSLTQWATHVQDVASGMILPPEAAVNCSNQMSWLSILPAFPRVGGKPDHVSSQGKEAIFATHDIYLSERNDYFI